MQVNITTQVNAQAIRREIHNGREHLVLPSYTLPANVVMNGGLYSESEIDKHYQGLEGTLAPLGHPQINGEYVSAFSPEGINAYHVGAWNRNVKKSGNRVYAEKWVDVETANQTEGGRELLARVNAIVNGEDVPPIHTSVAAFLDQLQPNEQQQAQGIQWIAKINRMDHDAILLHEVGAAQPDQGVGLMVNADAAQPVKPAGNTLTGMSYRERERALDFAARNQFTTNADDPLWIADFSDSQAVIVANGAAGRVYAYTVHPNGEITFDAADEPEQPETWVSVVTNKIKSIFKPQGDAPEINQTTEGEQMPLTSEEMSQIGQMVGEAVAANVEQATAPLRESIAALKANQDELANTLTANSRAEEQQKREAIAAAYGDVVANSLKGEALDMMFAKLGEATQIGANAAQEPNKETGAPDIETYFKGAN